MKDKTIKIILVVLLTLSFGIMFSIKIFDNVNKVDEVGNNNELNDNKSDNEIDKEDVVENSEEIENKEEDAEDNKEKDKINDKKENDKLDEENINEDNTTTSSDKKEEVSNTDNIEKEENVKTLVSTETKTEDNVTTKYGVKITTTTTYEVKTYSDDSEEKKEEGTKTTYDTTTFNATSSELKSDATSIASKNKSVYQEVVKYVNTYRSEVNVSEITLDDTLSILATVRALEMAWANKVSHTRPNGSDCFTVYSELGYSSNAKGENIAWGQKTAAEVSNDWYNSTGHRENMQNSMFNKIGIGMVEFNGSKYWVQLFAS